MDNIDRQLVSALRQNARASVSELALSLRGITLIEIEGKGNERIITRLRGFPEIQAIHSTNGRWDLIVEFGAETLADLDKVLRQMRLIDGINASETNLYLTTHRSNRVVGLFNNKGGDKK